MGSMRVRVRYLREYLRVRDQLDSLALRALEQIEDDIAEDPELGPHRRQIGDSIYDFHGLQGDLIVQYRRVDLERVEFQRLRDQRNPNL